jgi:vacuolar protein sorting-associated protein 13A/C
VEDFGDVIREGGGAFAKGLFRGVTGILTKPLEGAKTSGVEGFVQGVGRGIIGVAAQPVSSGPSVKNDGRCQCYENENCFCSNI